MEDQTPVVTTPKTKVIEEPAEMFHTAELNTVYNQYAGEIEEMYTRDCEMYDDLASLQYELWEMSAPSCTRAYTLGEWGVLLRWDYVQAPHEQSHIYYCYISKDHAEKLQELPITLVVVQEQAAILKSYVIPEKLLLMEGAPYATKVKLFSLIPKLYESVLIKLLTGE